MAVSYTHLENVAVVSCPHDEIDGITCRICGTKMVAKVAKDDTLRYFAVFEDAAQYAAALEGSAITLLRDALWGSMGLPTGTYTPVSYTHLYPGEGELLALAEGALRVLRGEETAKIYE